MTNDVPPSSLPLWLRAGNALTDNRSTALPLGMRLLLAVAALGILLESLPWSAAHPLAAATTLANFLFFGAVAITGVAPGRPRQVCYALGVAYVVLVVCKLLLAESA